MASHEELTALIHETNRALFIFQLNHETHQEVCALQHEAYHQICEEEHELHRQVCERQHRYLRNVAAKLQRMADEATAERTPGFRVGERKTLDEYQRLGKFTCNSQLLHEASLQMRRHACTPKRRNVLYETQRPLSSSLCFSL